ncbi:Tim44 domain-containing protein [Leptothrix cholodnii]|nr:Tim44-like domain-containing protein [Leptothrix cholodnii]
MALASRVLTEPLNSRAPTPSGKASISQTPEDDTMKNWLLAALMALVAVTTTLPADVEAKRLGSGGSAGMQRSMPARNDSAATPAKPAPAAQPGQQAGQQAGAAPAAAPKRNWMGPIAGLAAGLGIAALMSHLGLGEAFGNFLMMALLAVAAIALVAFLMRRFGSKGKTAPAAGDWAPAGAGAAGSSAGSGAQVAWPAAMQRSNAQEGSAAASFGQAGNSAGFNSASAPAFEPIGAAPTAAANLPADFDQAGFERIAKMIFIRMQAANDSGDLNDLRSFTTPEMFAHIRLELQERGNAPQTTDVVDVAAEVLDLTRDTDRDIVSVRYHGQIREAAGAPVTSFDEIWHLVQPRDGSRNWAISGIQQTN